MRRLTEIGASLLLLLASATSGFCADASEKDKDTKEAAKPKPTKEEVFSKENIARISETYGHFTYKSLNNPILKLDYDSVVKGLQDAKANKPSPMTEQEYEEAISLIQEYAFQDMSAKNLKQAEEYLQKNAKEKGVVQLEDGKLQYQITKPGDGETVTEDKMVVLHYTGRYVDGQVFGSSYDSKEPVKIILDQTIPGFRKGIVGMKVNEKRRLFIHPDLGYGTSGQLLPNALLIFDIEVVKLEPLPEEAEEVSSDDANDDASDDDSSDDSSDDDNSDNSEE